MPRIVNAARRSTNSPARCAPNKGDTARVSLSAGASQQDRRAVFTVQTLASRASSSCTRAARSEQPATRSGEGRVTNPHGVTLGRSCSQPQSRAQRSGGSRERPALFTVPCGIDLSSFPSPASELERWQSVPPGDFDPVPWPSD